MNENLVKALRAQGVDAEKLDEPRRAELLLSLERKLGVRLNGRPLWDNATAPDGLYTADGWELLEELGVNEDCFLFQETGSQIWRVAAGENLALVLRDCPPVEIYVSNAEQTGLVCCNDHDYLIGWGKAQAWIEALQSRGYGDVQPIG